MPRFTEQEKEIISNKLLIEGEKLFALHGLKKVTVDDLVAAVNISKGSFYAFYPNKEELYFNILVNCQKDMWQKMDCYLKQNHRLKQRELVKKTMIYLFELLPQYPLIKKTDSETMAVLFRKLPSKVIENHSSEDAEALNLFMDYGVRFTQPIDVVTKAFQALYGVIVLLEKEDEGLRWQVLTVMMNGLINELVEE